MFRGTWKIENDKITLNKILIKEFSVCEYEKFDAVILDNCDVNKHPPLVLKFDWNEFKIYFSESVVLERK